MLLEKFRKYDAEAKARQAVLKAEKEEEEKRRKEKIRKKKEEEEQLQNEPKIKELTDEEADKLQQQIEQVSLKVLIKEHFIIWLQRIAYICSRSTDSDDT